MPHVFNAKELKFEPRKSAIAPFEWRTSPRLAELVSAKRITKFDLRSLDPGKFSFPFHFHHAAEEIFVVLSGEATLRTPKGFRKIGPGDVVFFEEGPSGAHQLFNHGAEPCVYVDVNVAAGSDVVEYPDSGKLMAAGKAFRTSTTVNYYLGEEDVASRWPADVVGSTPAKKSASGRRGSKGR